MKRITPIPDASFLLSAIVESLDDAILSASLTGTIMTWNTAAERLYGYTAAEIVGEPVSILVPDDRAHEVGDILARLAAGERIDPFESRRRRKDGALVNVSLSISPVSDRDGRVIGATAVAHDVTARTELEQQRRRAQKLEALGSLAGGVAHDFNNLLTVILGCGTIALEPSSPEESREALEEIIRAAGRAGDLTRQLLAFSRQEPVVTSLVDLNSIVNDLATLLERVIEKNIDLEFLLDPALPPISSDPTQLEQIVMNLAVNARDAMPHGGKLTVATRHVMVTDVEARTMDGLEPGCYSALIVGDTGVGMSEQTKTRVFEPFFTTKPLGAGTGLGLATVLRIVEQAQGHVAIASEPGSGTVCTVYLPCAEDHTHPSVAARPPDDDETILVVEDDDGLRRLATTVLRLNGYRVIGVAGGDEAIAAAKAHEGSIHLVLSDVVMPRMSGPELVERLEDLGLTVPTVFMSGSQSEDIECHGLAATPGTILDKPFSPEMLLERVRSTLDRPVECV